QFKANRWVVRVGRAVEREDLSYERGKRVARVLRHGDLRVSVGRCCCRGLEAFPACQQRRDWQRHSPAGEHPKEGTSVHESHSSMIQNCQGIHDLREDYFVSSAYFRRLFSTP